MTCSADDIGAVRTATSEAGTGVPAGDDMTGSESLGESMWTPLLPC
ncbi:hypothetical protein SAMN04489726_3102 [Allokutzneria albata]|uniref:Uncharacterized protein n=1 Tax=Allokutzneria albata TaxID=211114 RepID=A0A1G9VLD3_ALLAB|nr:hypothetical protein SAMN04489726_3102 [Allokutzneria albata]